MSSLRKRASLAQGRLKLKGGEGGLAWIPGMNGDGGTGG